MSRLTDCTTIPKALEVLGKQAWLPHLDELAERFAGYEFSGGEKGIEKALENVIWDMVTLQEHTASAPVTRLFHRRVSELDCWLHRATRESGAGPEFWNPLESSYQQFRAGRNIHCYMTESGYPAKDVIRQWCKQRLT